MNEIFVVWITSEWNDWHIVSTEESWEVKKNYTKVGRILAFLYWINVPFAGSADWFKVCPSLQCKRGVASYHITSGTTQTLEPTLSFQKNVMKTNVQSFISTASTDVTKDETSWLEKQNKV